MQREINNRMQQLNVKDDDDAVKIIASAALPQKSKAPGATKHLELETFEAKTKFKYPSNMSVSKGHSEFLQKSLQKGKKFFDSADYQMAKQDKCVAKQFGGTGVAIPTPETVPVRKISNAQQKYLYTPNCVNLAPTATLNAL